MVLVVFAVLHTSQHTEPGLTTLLTMPSRPVRFFCFLFSASPIPVPGLNSTQGLVRSSPTTVTGSRLGPSSSPTKLPAHWVHAHLSRCCAIVAFSAIFARRFERRPHLYPACLTVSSALRVRIDPIVIGIFSGPHQRRRRY